MLLKGVTQSKVYTRSEYKEYLQKSKARSTLPLSSLGAHSSAHETGVAGAEGAAANEGSATASKGQERGAGGRSSSPLAVSPTGGLNCKNICVLARAHACVRAVPVRISRLCNSVAVAWLERVRQHARARVRTTPFVCARACFKEATPCHVTRTSGSRSAERRRGNGRYAASRLLP